MVERIKSIYIWLTIPVLAWLLYSQAELRFYREYSIVHQVACFRNHLEITDSALTEALRMYDMGDVNTGGFWLEQAEVNLRIADRCFASYSTALNRRFSSTVYGFGYLNFSETWFQGTVAQSVRSESVKDGALSLRNRTLLEALILDIGLVRNGLSQELLHQADGRAVSDAFQAIREKMTLRPLVTNPSP